MPDLPAVFRYLAALWIGVIASFAASRALFSTRIYDAFAAPLATVTVSTESGHRRIIDYLQGGISLFAVYLSVALVLAFTGGTIGMTSMDWSPETSRSHIIWGFTCGMLVVALARISAVYLSTALASYLQLLTIFAIGACAYCFVLNYRFMTEIVDKSLCPAGGSYFVFFVVAAILGTGALVEIGIWLVDNRERGNVIPYALMTERIQQFTKIEQVFVPGKVDGFTADQIRNIIEEEGLKELLWVTHTMPTKVLDGIKAALKSRGEDDKDIEKLLTDPSRVRIVIAADKLPRFLHRGISVENGNLKCLHATTRVRYLVLNRCHAVVHLPLPYSKKSGENSNCAHWLASRALVTMWRKKFDELWDSLP